MTQMDEIGEKVRRLYVDFKEGSKTPLACAISGISVCLVIAGVLWWVYTELLRVQRTDPLWARLPMFSGLAILIPAALTGAIVKQSRKRKTRAAFAAAFPAGSPARRTALRSLHDILKPPQTVDPLGGDHVAGAGVSLEALVRDFEALTGERRRALDEFAVPFPPPADNSEAGLLARRWPSRTTITCSLWEAGGVAEPLSVTFARYGSGVIAKIHLTGCLVGVVVEMHKPEAESAFTSLLRGFELGRKGVGKIEFKDQKGEKWSFRIEREEMERLREWLEKSAVETMAAQDGSLNALLARIDPEGTGLAAPYHATEMDAPRGADSVLLAWAGPGLLVFRENKSPHPLFDQQCAVFSNDRFSLQRGTGSAATNLGLRLGGLGTLTAMHIDDASGKTFRIMGRNEVIEAIISEAYVRGFHKSHEAP